MRARSYGSEDVARTNQLLQVPTITIAAPLAILPSSHASCSRPCLLTGSVAGRQVIGAVGFGGGLALTSICYFRQATPPKLPIHGHILGSLLGTQRSGIEF